MQLRQNRSIRFFVSIERKKKKQGTKRKENRRIFGGGGENLFECRNTFAIDPGLDRKSIESVALPRLDSSSVIGGKGIQKLTKRSRNRTIYKTSREDSSLSLSLSLAWQRAARERVYDGSEHDKVWWLLNGMAHVYDRRKLIFQFRLPAFFRVLDSYASSFPSLSSLVLRLPRKSDRFF